MAKEFYKERFIRNVNYLSIDSLLYLDLCNITANDDYLQKFLQKVIRDTDEGNIE